LCNPIATLHVQGRDFQGAKTIVVDNLHTRAN
jgi:hypothetical protein